MPIFKKRPHMKKYKFEYFKASEINPTGWIKHQLETQLSGLSGHLCDFWPDISDCAWIGGSHDSWERTPYWLDGYIPLVYLLNDKKGIKTVEFYVKNIISRQQEDGWIAPQNADRAKYDVWGIFIVLKALLEYAKIKNSKKVYDAIYRGLKALDKHIDQYPLFDWAKYRWFEPLLVIFEIHKKYKEDWLVALANKLHDQGFDYFKYYQEDFLKTKCPKGVWNLYTHGVNNAMAVKAYGLYSMLSEQKIDFKKADFMLKTLMKYHGNVMGTFNADECFAGQRPEQGSELCLIVELMYSLEVLSKISGKDKYFDQLERLAFNALPNALTSDMWAHQYDTQVNAPFIKANENNPWTDNGPESNIYGLEPHFGCCTSNFHQGWPKFVVSAFAHRGKSIYVNSYIPVNIETKKYTLYISGGYPFKDKVVIEINSNVETNINFRIPKFAKCVLINKNEYKKNGYVKLLVNKGNNKFEIEIKKEPEFVKGKYGYSLVDGSLVYALRVDGEPVQINMDKPFRELPHGDFEIWNKSKFNYGLLDLDLSKEEKKCNLDLSPFASGKYPTSYLLNCCEVDYDEIGNYVKLKNKPVSQPERKEFIPIGISKLHMGVLPLVKK